MRIKDTGYWHGVIPEVTYGALYKYFITSRLHAYQAEKTDPYAFHSEIRPATASVVWDLDGHDWQDREWMIPGRNAISIQRLFLFTNYISVHGCGVRMTAAG